MARMHALAIATLLGCTAAVPACSTDDDTKQVEPIVDVRQLPSTTTTTTTMVSLPATPYDVQFTTLTVERTEGNGIAETRFASSSAGESFACTWSGFEALYCEGGPPSWSVLRCSEAPDSSDLQCTDEAYYPSDLDDLTVWEVDGRVTLCDGETCWYWNERDSPARVTSRLPDLHCEAPRWVCTP